MSESTIRERARAAAAEVDPPPFPPDGTAPAAATFRQPDAAPEAPALPDVDYGDRLPDWAEVSVHIAWNRVMEDVRSVSKGDKMTAPGQGGYSYRGIDRVLNAVGPALRRHCVAIWPVDAAVEYDKIQSRQGSSMRQASLVVRYKVFGPKGDHIDVASPGEAFDSSDKSTTKGNSIAYRNLLIVALALPTQDPRLDAEATHIERGESALPSPDAYYAELTAERPPSLQRCQTIRRELQQHPAIGQREFIVDGAEMTLLELVTTVGRRVQAEQQGQGSR